MRRVVALGVVASGLAACGGPSDAEKWGKLDGQVVASSPNECVRLFQNEAILGHVDGFSEKEAGQFEKACRAAYAAAHGG